MKHSFTLLLLALLAIPTYADPDLASISLGQKGGDHSNLPFPADMPDVYYDSGNQQIIIDGLGVVTYYDVEIASATNWTVYISTQVNGSYGTLTSPRYPKESMSLPSTAHWTTPTRDTSTPFF